jgi:hypothetical protein
MEPKVFGRTRAACIELVPPVACRAAPFLCHEDA